MILIPIFLIAISLLLLIVLCWIGYVVLQMIRDDYKSNKTYTPEAHCSRLESIEKETQQQQDRMFALLNSFGYAQYW